MKLPLPVCREMNSCTCKFLQFQVWLHIGLLLVTLGAGCCGMDSVFFEVHSDDDTDISGRTDAEEF